MNNLFKYKNNNNKMAQKVDHVPLDILKLKLEEIESDPFLPKHNQIYRHYKKGDFYVVDRIALREEDEKPVIVYYHLDSKICWTRLLSDWNARLTIDENGKKYVVKRFTFTGSVVVSDTFKMSWKIFSGMLIGGMILNSIYKMF